MSNSLITRAIASLRIVVLGVALSACSVAAPVEGEETARRSDAWDSESGNPTHASHSYLTDYAISAVAAAYPEAVTYRNRILAGANTEIHDVHLDDPNLEVLRNDFGGTNAACDHPETVWQYADAWHRSGNLEAAYWFAGLLLHYVEDMGVPAHALGVYHQGDLTHFDDFELLALQRYAPRFDVDYEDPCLEPSEYVAWSQARTMDEFASTFPETNYTTHVFPRTWLFVTDRQQAFIERREGGTAIAAALTLSSILRHWNESEAD